MRIALHASGGPGIGLGHVKRIEALGSALLSLGVEVVPCAPWEWTPADAMVFDSYRVTSAHLLVAKMHYPLIAAITDGREYPLANVTIVPGVRDTGNYTWSDGMLMTLSGPKYILLGPEYRSLPPRKQERQIRRVLVTLGGGDPYDLTPRIIDAVRTALPGAMVGVAVGAFFTPEQQAEIARRVEDGNGRIGRFAQPDSLAPLLDLCDLVICGGGVTMLEAAATSCPSMTIQLADNQASNLTSLSLLGGTYRVGTHDDPGLMFKLAGGLRLLSDHPTRRQEMADIARSKVDGMGATRVAKHLVELVERKMRPS